MIMIPNEITLGLLCSLGFERVGVDGKAFAITKLYFYYLMLIVALQVSTSVMCNLTSDNRIEKIMPYTRFKLKNVIVFII